jgi:hypothetical protein
MRLPQPDRNSNRFSLFFRGKEISFTYAPKGFLSESNPDPLARRKVQISESIIGNKYFKGNLSSFCLDINPMISPQADDIDDFSLNIFPFNDSFMNFASRTYISFLPPEIAPLFVT